MELDYAHEIRLLDSIVSFFHPYLAHPHRAIAVAVCSNREMLPEIYQLGALNVGGFPKSELCLIISRDHQLWWLACSSPMLCRFEICECQIALWLRNLLLLRMLTGKEHLQTNMDIWYKYGHLCSWYIKSTLLKRFLYWSNFFQKN